MLFMFIERFKKSGGLHIGTTSVVFAILLFANNCKSGSVDAETIVSGMKAKMTLPVAVDDDTRLDDVRAISKTEIGYLLTLTKLTKAQLAGNPIGKQLESGLRAGACQNPDYLKLFRAGIALRIVYQTRDQADVTQIAMVPKDCGL